jgi:HEAT repeat protein
MLIVVPYKTYGPVEHAPWGTVGLLLANVAVVVFLGFPEPVVESFWGGPVEEPFVNSLILEFGKFNPLTWITNSFVHFDWLHLILNMLGLWIFGVIVEGLIGWRRLDEPVRFGAASALAAFGFDREAQVRALGSALRDRSVRVRRKAAEALEYTAPLGHAVEADLVRALKDEDRRVRRAAAAALGANGIIRRESIPPLLEALGDKATVFGAKDALASRGKEVVPVLIRVLKEGETTARVGAALALGRIGRPASGALTPLTDIIEDKRASEELRFSASIAVRAILADMPTQAIGIGGGAGR